MKQFFPHLKQCIIATDSTLRRALQAIADSGAMMACVTNPSGRLIGILTDSDIRKALLLGANVDDPINPWINLSPIIAPYTLDEEELRCLAISEGIREIPLVDSHGHLIDIYVTVIHDHRIESESAASQVGGPQVLEFTSKKTSMLLLAGGKGTRLRSVVNDRPKPLALVGGRPIIQTIIQNAASQGVTKFYIAVNYMADKITDHLASTSYQGLQFEVLREDAFLGTAGCIGMLPKDLKDPLLVANADVLTNVNFQALLEHHQREKAGLTCVVRSHLMTVPFGVVQIQDDHITGIVEKPNISNLVNAGIYVLNPEIVSQVGHNTYLDMPVLIQKLASSGTKVSPFFMHEYWMDIGRPDDFHKANKEFYEHFGSKVHDY